MDPRTLKKALPRTWEAFFGRYGSFTPAQLAAIPLLLAGQNVILSAPTAGGKTEAALAPLVERHLSPGQDAGSLAIIYLLPTRALIHDLQRRIAVPLQTLRISCAAKTHDLNSFDPQRPAGVLLTTPESLDTLLASQAKVLRGVRAVVIDELHVFDGTVRGDQLRVLLNRLRQVRAYALQAGDVEDDRVQYVALSATLGDAEPERVAARYFPEARPVQVPGHRPIRAEQLALDPESPQALLDYIATFRMRGWRKALVFCNTRAEIESYAAVLRAAGSPFGSAVSVHYSNLDRERRREVEQSFAQAQAAICFASSTLELGIDIGDVDVTMLIGAPGDRAAFVQRIGRSGRRKQETQAALFYRTALERACFGALQAGDEAGTRNAPFHPSVAIQQIFSLLKQSPAGSVRLNPLADLFSGMLTESDLLAILGELQARGYLKGGRAGEWRAGERLNRLVDLQWAEFNPFSLHGNIAAEGGPPVKIRDLSSRRVLASVDRQYFDSEALILEGRALKVEWYDSEAVWVSAAPRLESVDRLRYRSTPQLLSYELARRLPEQVGLSPASAPLVPSGDGWLLFHWLGSVYGRAVLDLARYTLPASATPEPGICLLLHDEPRALPTWSEEQVTRYLHEHYRRYEPLLALGAYHSLLPAGLRRRSVIEQFDVPRFVRGVAMLHIEHAPEELTERLQPLATGG